MAVYRRFDSVADPHAYARACILHAATRRARRQQRWRRAVPLLARPEAIEDTHDDFDTLVAALSPRQATAVFLRYYLDLSEADIATVMGCRPGTVKSTLSAALHRLEEVLR